MSSSPKLCPICNHEMVAHRFINESLSNHFYFVDKDKTSFIYYNCTLPDIVSDNRPYPIHTYSLYTTLYDGNYYQGVYLLEHNIAVRVFHALYKTEIEYFSVSTEGRAPGNYLEDTTIITLDNRLLKFDFPKLEKVIKKAKSLAPFL